MIKSKLNSKLTRHGDSAMARKLAKVRKSDLARKENRKVKSDIRNYIW